MRLSLLIQDQRDFVLSILRHYHQIILYDEVSPDLYDFLEEGFSIDKLSGLLEQLSHVVVAFAQIDALRAMLLALHINAAGQFFQGLLMSIRSVLSHEKSAEGQIERSMVSLKLLLSHKCVFSSSAPVITATLLATLEQVPVCCDEELFCFLQLGTSHSNVCLCQDEVSRKQLNRLFVKDFSLNGLTHFVIDVLVSFLVLLINDVLFCHLDRSIYLVSTLSLALVSLSVISLKLGLVITPMH